MNRYEKISVSEIRREWEDICVKLQAMFDEVYDRVYNGKFSPEEDRDNLEDLYYTIRSAIDYEGIENVANDVSVRKEIKR